VSFIQIAPGSPTQPLLKNTPHQGKYPVLHSRPSAISDLLSGGGTVLARTVEALNRVNRVLSDDNIHAFSGTLQDVQAVADEARKEKRLFADADQALKNIDATASSIKSLSDNTNGMMSSDGRRALHNAADAADQLRGAASEARGLLSKFQGPTSDFATNGLPQLTAAVGSLRQAADSLNRLSSELEESPQSLIGKSPPKEVEVRP
jgi:phospholipid/cholesterol/gamma-HCH transport system substrate-binding protein